MTTLDTAALAAWIDDTVAEWRPVPGLLYAGPADFVRRHGRWYDVARTAPGAPRLCYANAIGYAVAFGWAYVEGYAMVPLTPGSSRTVAPGVVMRMAAGDEVVQHAWCVDDAGRPVEVTWPVPGRAYRGVAFAAERADDATWNGDATVLDDFHRGWPLLRREWPPDGDPGDVGIDDAARARLTLVAALARRNAAAAATETLPRGRIDRRPRRAYVDPSTRPTHVPGRTNAPR